MGVARPGDDGVAVVLGPAEAVGREGDGHAVAHVWGTRRVAGLEEEGFVEPVGIGIARVVDDVGVCGVEHHEVVVAGAFVLDQAEVWAFPEDAVVGGGVADGVEEVAAVEALPGGIADVVAHAGNAHAAVTLIPHAELAGLLVSPDGAVES